MYLIMYGNEKILLTKSYMRNGKLKHVRDKLLRKILGKQTKVTPDLHVSPSHLSKGLRDTTPEKF